MAEALGDHPQLIAWQIDNSMGGNNTEFSFNEATREEWHLWLQAKYEKIERLNDLLGLRFWGQTVTAWDQVPMPMYAPAMHNPALLLDWNRFSSDTMVQFVKMQADLLHERCPQHPVTVTMRAFLRQYDHFDMADVVDFVSIESNVVMKATTAELACDVDMLRSLKKSDIRTPDGDCGFWAMEQKVGQVNWQDVNSLVQPGLIRLFTYQLISRGASGILYFRWRQPRIGSEKFYGAILPHHIEGNNRVFMEISQIGDELKLLAPSLKDTKVVSEVCILYSHDNDWSLQQPNQPNKYFSLREHIQLIYNALHDRNIPVDFARPSEDISQYKIVFAPSLHLLAPAEADRLKLYVQNGGTLVSTFNTGLVDQHHIAPDTGFPNDMTDLFGLEVLEFDPIPPGEENHLTFKGAFPTSHLHPARLWCDIIEPKGCQVLAVYAKGFYASRPAMTMNTFGLGKAIYIGTMSHQHFYNDFVGWLRQMCNLHPLLKVPENVEVCMRQKEGTRVYFLLNHQNSPVRIQFYKPMHDFLTGNTFSGNYDLPPHGVLVLDEHPEVKQNFWRERLISCCLSAVEFRQRNFRRPRALEPRARALAMARRAQIPAAPARAETEFAPAISLLKPLKGCDATTAESLQSWFNQNYSGQTQILFGVADANDPVCKIVREIIAKNPKCDAQLVVCENSPAPTPKSPSSPSSKNSRSTN